MLRYIHSCTLLTLLTCFGCGKAEVEVSQTDPAAMRSNTAAVESTANLPSPTDVVSQFLDQVRRGGQDSGAGTLLTEKARSELKRIGRNIQPMGSPDARYEVTRFELVPGQDDSALVHSIWSDPDGQGGQSNYQVVWAVVRESAGWRISGMAIEEKEGEQPVIIDFENGDLMAEVLGASDVEKTVQPTENQSQAAAAPQSVNR